MKKILFITPHRTNRSPGQRFRFEQYLDYLRENGYSYEVSFIISEKDDENLYQKGRYFKKLLIVLKSLRIRIKDLTRIKDFDIVFIFRQALLVGPPIFEKLYARSKAKIVFDFDDSIWLDDTSDANRKLRWLKYPGNAAKIISLSDMTFAGNRYLADYALKYNKNVKVVPTTIDTDWHKRTVYRTNESTPICIGWTGSITTIKHFQYAVPVLLKLKEKYGDRIVFKVIGDGNYKNEELNIKGITWARETEIAELSTFDIGIMPLPNDEWSKGKCGFKGLQYMALEIPAILSPVGVNTEIINDGVNGFLAASEQEWLEKASLLIEDAKLREGMGKEARKTVLEKYSKNSEKGNYIKYFNEVLSMK